MRTHCDSLPIKKIACALAKGIALTLLVINTGTATASVIDRQKSCGSNSGCYEISGEITASDVIQARRLFASKFIPMVLLNSPGGDLHAAIEIGTLLRSVRAVGLVLPGASCESACVFLLAGATQRSVKGRIGIHRPYSLVTGYISPAIAQANYAKIQAKSKKFLEEMNLPSALYEAMVRTPPEDMRYLSDREVAAFGLDAADPVEQEVSNSYHAGKYGLTKQEYLARKKAVYESCNPALQRTGDAVQYFLCEEQILTGSVSNHPALEYQRAPSSGVETPANDPEISVVVDYAIRKYPFLDHTAPYANLDAITEVNKIRDSYIREGYAAPQAIRMAVDGVAPKYAR